MEATMSFRILGLGTIAFMIVRITRVSLSRGYLYTY